MVTAQFTYIHITELLTYNEFKRVQKEVVILPCHLSGPPEYKAGVLHMAACLVCHGHSEGRKYFISSHSPDITQIPAMVAQSRTTNWIGESLSCVTWTLRALTSYLKNIPGIP